MNNSAIEMRLGHGLGGLHPECSIRASREIDAKGNERQDSQRPDDVLDVLVADRFVQPADDGLHTAEGDGAVAELVAVDRGDREEAPEGEGVLGVPAGAGEVEERPLPRLG